jgi:hypothetical protein
LEEDLISISSTDLMLSSKPSPPRRAEAAKTRAVFREAKPDVCLSGNAAGKQGKHLNFDSSSASDPEGSGASASSGEIEVNKAPPGVIELLESSSEDLSILV